jgi:tRNA (guanine26-N2/guanine27-N2)-dimethyltransferase
MKKITEGRAEIFVPEESLTKASETFYNPAMEHQRNVTVACVRLAGAKNALDPLAATGVRGIRLLKEAKAGSVVFNDINPSAIKLIRKNLALNKIREGSYEISRKDANQLFLEKNRFDYVDIDPFGSPIKYLRSVAYSLRKGSLLGVTATDSGALAGKFAEACFRRYGMFVSETDFPKELGVRVLITSILKNLATHNMTFEPLYSHANHYFRVIGRVSYGPEKNISKISMVSYCPKCHNRKIGIDSRCDNCKGKMKHIGPIWTGKIQDREFCKRMLASFEFQGKKEIELSAEEIDHPFYYDVHMLAQSLKASPPKMETLIEKLRSKGFEASRTHLEPMGIKTDADVKEIKEILFSCK